MLKDSCRRAARETSLDSGESDDKSEVFTVISQVPESRCQVIIHTPSKTWRPATMAKPENPRELSCLDSSISAEDSTFSEQPEGSAFTMSEYGSLGWDDSGPEFSDTMVELKASRSSPLKLTTVAPTKQLPNKHTPRGLKIPKSSDAVVSVADQSNPKPARRTQKSCKDLLPTNKARETCAESPFFSPPASAEKQKASPPKEKKPRQRGGTVSCIPFPPLSAASFGLLQEKLVNDPFRLLIGVTFLNRTVGKYAIPAFFSLMEKYPTPADIIAADRNDIIAMTRHLGLQAQRADTYIKYAQFWIHDPPVKGRRYRVDHYPEPGDGMDIKRGDVLDDDDPRSAWEIGHMTQGRYAIDSWRIFCRDILRGEAEGWNGEGRDDGFQPEWMRVLPRDKELIACLRWMWLKEGFEWDPVTGEKEVAGRELMEAAIAGQIAWDDRGGMRIIDNAEGEQDVAAVEGDSAAVSRTA